MTDKTAKTAEGVQIVQVRLDPFDELAYFAAHALTGVIQSAPAEARAADIARWAFEIAAAMQTEMDQ